MSSVSGNENNAASATPHKELASEGLFEVLGTSIALQWWDVCSVNKHVFRHCLSDADICLYLLSIQTSGCNELCGRQATYGPRAGGDRGWDIPVAIMTSCGPTCVFYVVAQGFLSISQPLHRFPQHQFPEPAVADARAPKSCKDWWLKMQFSAVKRSRCCSRLGSTSGQVPLCLGVFLKILFWEWESCVVG